jgi:hypothetical protein
MSIAITATSLGLGRTGSISRRPRALDAGVGRRDPAEPGSIAARVGSIGGRVRSVVEPSGGASRPGPTPLLEGRSLMSGQPRTDGHGPASPE